MDTPSHRRRATIGRLRSAWLAGAAAPVFLLTFAMQLAAQERRPDPRLERLRELQQAERQASVSLTARPVRVAAGDEVMFTARLIGELSPEVRERAAFELHFGDGQTVPLEEPRAVHVYERPGQFRAYVVMRVEMRAQVVEDVVSEPVMISVGERQVDVREPGLRLLADPPEVPAGQPVRFFAQLDPPPEGPVDYRFDFGDGAVRDWSSDPTAVHVYERPGEFRAVVAAGVNEDPFARSAVGVAVIAAYSLGLEASDRAPEAGEPVRLTGWLEPPVDGARFRFEYGDGGRSEWLAEPVEDHAYERPGLYEVVLRASVGERVVASTGLALRVRSVEPAPPIQLPPITLVVRPREARPGDVVRFEALGPPRPATVEYRFHFGDGEATGWRRGRVAEHRYLDDGEYEAFVEVRNATGLVQESDIVPLVVVAAPTPTPTPPDFPWELLIGGAALALLGSAIAIGLRRGGRVKPREPAPTGSHLKVEAHPDDGTRGLDRGHDTLIRAELRLRPVFDPGQQSIESDGPVIKREWTLTTPLESQ